MQTKETFRITLNIAGKSYPLNIEREKEEIFRKAEKEINRWVATLESQFLSDTEGYLAMSALQLALKVVEMETSRSLGDDIDALQELDRKLDEHLNKLR